MSLRTTDLYPLHTICLGCYRERISMTATPPRVKNWPEGVCELCGRRTTHGIWIVNRVFQRLLKQRTVGE